MKCEDVQELIFTDYLDGQLGKEQETQIEEHLAICGDCKEHELLARKTAFGPFVKAERHSPPGAIWHKIKEQIEEERPLQGPTSSFADLIRRIKTFFYIPKPAFIVATITVLLFVTITVIKFRPEEQNIVKVDPENQIECINYLITVFEQEPANGDDDFGTSIEELFL